MRNQVRDKRRMFEATRLCGDSVVKLGQVQKKINGLMQTESISMNQVDRLQPNIVQIAAGRTVILTTDPQRSFNCKCNIEEFHCF